MLRLQRCTKTCGALQTLHESGDVMDAEIRQVMVNQSEYAKFVYLVKVMDALDRADKRIAEDIEHFSKTEFIKTDRQFDWNQVSRFCAPQLLISFLRGAERWEDERHIRAFPHSVIVARTADVVFLDEVFELSLESESVDNNTVDSVHLFSQLRSLAQSKKGMTAMDVEPLIRKLERALATK